MNGWVKYNNLTTRWYCNLDGYVFHRGLHKQVLISFIFNVKI